MDPNSPNTPVPVQQANTRPDPYYGNTPSGGSKLKKLIFILIGIILLVLLIVGGVILAGRLQKSGKSENVTLKYWGLWDEATIMQPIIDDFERTHPNIKVQYEKQDIRGLGQYVDRLTTRINNGTGPDIIRFHSSWTLQLKNHLLPFPQDTVNDIQLEKDFYKTVERDLKLNGAYYGVPLGVDTLALFVNTNQLQDKGLSIPTDWNDIYIKHSIELVTKDANGKIITPSIGLGTYDNISHAPDIVALLLLQNGADLKDMTGATSTNAIDAFKYYTIFAEGENASWDQTLDNSTLAFAKGNLPLYFGYSWDIFTIRSLNPTLEYEVVNVPSNSKRNNTVASYWAEGVSSKSPNSEEAFEFLTYLSKSETMQKLYATQAKVRPFGVLYARRSMAPLLSSNKLVYPFVAQADNAQSTFFSSDTFDGENGMITQLNVYLGNAIRSINNNTSIQTAVETLAKGITQVLSRYQ